MGGVLKSLRLRRRREEAGEVVVLALYYLYCM